MFCFRIIRNKYSISISCLASWVASLSDKAVRAKIIKAYLTGLRSHHIDVDYFDSAIEAFHHSILQRVIAEIRRLQENCQTRERRSITRDLLLRLLHQFDQFIIQSATWHAFFCLAFVDFLRMSEFTWAQSNRTSDFRQWHLIRRSVIFLDEALKLTLSSFKTDLFRREVTLIIAATDDKACAKVSLNHLIIEFSAPLLTPLFDSEYSFTRTHVTEILRNTLTAFSIKGHYSEHFFRRGAVISTRQAELSNEEIQLLKRWKSDSYRLYIEAQSSYILNVFRRHQR